jgi:precorrin-6A/cobalt-precorrin-6A reductase
VQNDAQAASPSERGAEGDEATQSREAANGQRRAARDGAASQWVKRKILLLAGTSEARALAERIAADARYEGVASLAGRTGAPLALALPTRIGGFGGVVGLERYLVEARITHVVDATHPFAAQISANAEAACAALGLPLIVFARAAWRAGPGDNWIEVADNAAAARALGAAPRRVFLTIGRQGVADFRAAPLHDYLLRVIEAPEATDLPPGCDVIFARGPFAKEDEIALMRERRIEVVVSKNSGGALTYAKIEAARELGLPVVMIAPPKRRAAALVHDLDAAMALLAQ